MTVIRETEAQSLGRVAYFNACREMIVMITAPTIVPTMPNAIIHLPPAERSSSQW